MESLYTLQAKIPSKNSEMYRATRNSDQKKVIIKKIRYSTLIAKQKQQIVDEVNLLTDLKNNHVLKYFEHFLNKNQSELSIVMEDCEAGTLQTLIYQVRKQNQRLPEDSIWKIFTQVVSGLHCLHSNKNSPILHRNIKPSSIYLDSERNVKLGGFSLAKKLEPEEHFAETFLPGTNYLSPEQLESGIFTKSTDIWALGCLLYELCLGQPPFQAKNEFEMAKLVKDGKPKKLSYSNELNRVIFWCLAKRAEQRPSVDDLQSVPEINIRIRERRIQEQCNIIKKRQALLEQKEKEIDLLECSIEEERKCKLKQQNHSDLMRKKSLLLRNNSKMLPLNEVYASRDAYN